MALGIEFIDDYIEYWTVHLGNGGRTYRKHWPRCLFHHAPLENALSILREGYIRSRNDPARAVIRDVAAPGVISNRREAHDRVRLYFRPRTPTQFHIEGIRKSTECQYGADTHAPVLVMFVLDARKILSLPDVQFSDRNMQSSGARTGDDAEFFKSIPFEKVFHEGGTGGDNSIVAHRCAEVLPTSPLKVSDVLHGIWFRSEPERDTLLHLLGEDRNTWENFSQVSEEIKVFDKRFSFISEIGLSTKGITFRVNYRYDLGPIDICIEALDSAGKLKARFKNDAFTTHNSNSGRWIYNCTIEPGQYLVRATIEGHLAYENMLVLGGSLF